MIEGNVILESQGTLATTWMYRLDIKWSLQGV
jgi:hypothetical protein